MEKSRLRNFLIVTLLFLGYSQDAAKSHVDNFQSMWLWSADVVSLKHNEISQDEVIALELPDAYTISRDTLVCNASVSHLDTVWVQDRLFEIWLRFFPQDTLSYSDIMYDYDTFIKTLDPSVLTAGTDDADISYVEHVMWRTHFDHLWVSQYDHRSGLASSWWVHPSWLYSRLYEIGFAMQDRKSNKITTFDMELFDWLERCRTSFWLDPVQALRKWLDLYIPPIEPSLKQQSEKELEPEPFILPKEQFLDTITTVTRKYRWEWWKVVSLTQTQYPWAEARAILESLWVRLWSTNDQHLTQGDENGAGWTCLEWITDITIHWTTYIVDFLKQRLWTEYIWLINNASTDTWHKWQEDTNAWQQKDPNTPASYAAHGTWNSSDWRVVWKEWLVLKELFSDSKWYIRIWDIVYFYRYHKKWKVFHLHITMYHISHFQSLKPSKVSEIIDKTYVLSQLSDTSFTSFQDTLK
jgi:hypothetical protein